MNPLAGAEGFEPSDVGVKVPCVRPLHHAPISILYIHIIMNNVRNFNFM